MKIIAADWLPYRLPLKSPWQTSKGIISERQGRLLRLKTDDGLTGWGDAAPLPDFGISETAARDFAEECAHFDLAAQRAGVNLASYLSGEPAPETVAVNAILGPIFSVAVEDIPDGFPIIKLKIGINPLAEEIHRLQQLSEQLPIGVRWRLDANAAWSLSDARRFIDACRELPVEGLEEPLAEPELGALGKLQEAAAFPLAIDESTHLLNADFWQNPPVRRLIIKPARCGGLLGSLDLALRARNAGLEVVVTASLESACGLLACAQLAAAIAPRSTHGLAGNRWFAEDTGAGPSIENGQLALPRQNGLGFTANTGFSP